MKKSMKSVLKKRCFGEKGEQSEGKLISMTSMRRSFYRNWGRIQEMEDSLKNGRISIVFLHSISGKIKNRHVRKISNDKFFRLVVLTSRI